MRTSLLFAMIVGGAVFGREVQQTAVGPVQDVLANWAKAREAVLQSHCTARVTTTDQVSRSMTKSTAEIWYRKSDLLRVDFKDEKGALSAAVFCKGREMHLYTDGEELVTQLDDAYGFPDRPDRFPVTLTGKLKGACLEGACRIANTVPVKTLQARYEVRRIQRETDWIAIELQPRTPKDREEFQRMQVVLSSKDFQVRRLFIRQPGQDLLVDYDEPDTKTPVTSESITKGLPVGLKRQEWQDLKKISK